MSLLPLSLTKGKQWRLEQILANVQASHQKMAWATAKVDLRSQEAYELASQGTVPYRTCAGRYRTVSAALLWGTGSGSFALGYLLSVSGCNYTVRYTACACFGEVTYQNKTST